MTKISVIIPCFNQGKYIAECLDSVIAQTFAEWEAIVVNDGSNDSSLDIITRYTKKDSRIKLINQKNQGVVAARNNAIAAARGDFIYPLDGDDIITPQCLAKLYAAMMAGRGDVIYSDVLLFGKNNGVMQLPRPTKKIMSQDNCVVCSALYRKSDALKYGGYDENMRDGWEDWEFWCNFIYGNKVFYKVPELLFCYRQLEKSRNTSFDAKKQAQLISYIKSKHFGFRFCVMLRKMPQTKIARFIFRAQNGWVKIFKIPVYKTKEK